MLLFINRLFTGLKTAFRGWPRGLGSGGCIALRGLLAFALNCPAATPPPHFVEHTIATGLTGGYQVVVADLNHDGKPDLIALASGLPELVWFENPGWQRHVLASGFTQMINCVVLDWHGRRAIVLASGFSNDARHSSGNVWLLQPGPDLLQPWTKKEIDRLPTAHRLRLAAPEGNGAPIVLCAPLTDSQATPPDYRGHPPLVFYRPDEWRRTLLTAAEQGVMHGICVTDWDGGHRDQILTASFAGIHRYALSNTGVWARTEITRGDPAPWPKCGSSDVAVGHLDPGSGNVSPPMRRRFVCSIEPWHGHQLVLYLEDSGAWKRQVLDDTLHDGHALATDDFNGDGRDEIIAGYRGQGGGLLCFSADGPDGSRWTRSEIDMGGVAAASCAVADLNGDGRPDLVAIGSATANLKWYENINGPRKAHAGLGKAKPLRTRTPIRFLPQPPSPPRTQSVPAQIENRNPKTEN